MSIVKAAIFTWSIAVQPTVPEPPEKLPVQLQGHGSYYGTSEDTQFWGSHMANGEPFEPKKRATIATKPPPEGPPLGTWVLVETPKTGRSMWLERTDSGPYTVKTPAGDIKPVTPQYSPNPGEQWVRVADLSVKAAKQLGVYGGGIFEIRVRYWSDDVEQVGRFARRFK